MKKIVLTALIAVAFVSSSFANGTSVNHAVRRSFESQFTASKVQWTNVGQYLAATFINDHKVTLAYFDHAGTMLGTAVQASAGDLPTYAKRYIAKKYEGYDLTEVLDFTGTETSTYFVSAEKNGDSIILMVADGQVSKIK